MHDAFDDMHAMGKKGAVDRASFSPAVVHGGSVDAHSHRAEPDDTFRRGRSDEGRIEIFLRVGIPTRARMDHDEGVSRDGIVFLQLNLLVQECVI